MSEAELFTLNKKLVESEKELKSKLDLSDDELKKAKKDIDKLKKEISLFKDSTALGYYSVEVL